MLCLHSFDLLEVSFDLKECAKNVVIFKELKVFLMKVGLVGALELLLWLSRIDSFEDAESSEVLEVELKFSDSSGPGEVLGCFAFLSCLNTFAHLAY